MACTGAESAALSGEYAERLCELQAMLTFSHDAARSFYREPGHGMRVIRKRLLRHLMLKTYTDGVPHARLLTALRATARQIV